MWAKLTREGWPAARFLAVLAEHEIGDPWVERIPFPETRNYVQRIIESIQVYRVLLRSDKRSDPRNTAAVQASGDGP
jgi:hypothetical protein